MTIAVYPNPISTGLASALHRCGIETAALTDVAALAEEQPAEGWAALVVELGEDPLRALSMRALSTARRAREEQGIPVLVVVSQDHVIHLEGEPIDDFLLTPVDPVELGVRLRRLIGFGESSEVLRFKNLELNTATYQATVGHKPVDLTYMEYELLRFFVTNPRRVWSREQLLSKVWGYDYFGGARTVDVHVRRLRAKLGEERASWITTVRSVGYRFS